MCRYHAKWDRWDSGHGTQHALSVYMAVTPYTCLHAGQSATGRLDKLSGRLHVQLVLRKRRHLLVLVAEGQHVLLIERRSRRGQVLKLLPVCNKQERRVRAGDKQVNEASATQEQAPAMCLGALTGVGPRPVPADLSFQLVYARVSAFNLLEGVLEGCNVTGKHVYSGGLVKNAEGAMVQTMQNINRGLPSILAMDPEPLASWPMHQESRHC